MDPTGAKFEELRQIVTDAGLLKPQALFYAFYAFGLAGMWALSLYILGCADTFFWRLSAVALFAFVWGQTALFFHDAGHGQIVKGEFATKLIEACFNMLTGLSLPGWRPKHNTHHAFPNHNGRDPDIEISFLAFWEYQCKKKKGITRQTARYQHIFFVPLLFFEIWHLRIAGIRYLLNRSCSSWRRELFLISLHTIVHVAVWVYIFGHITGPGYFILHQGLVGIYVGMIFATNHKGMPLISEGGRGYVETQVTTARNIKGGALTTFIFGGLNFQIEHHLFPRAPRLSLRLMQPIVKNFCAKHNVPYCEETPLAAYRSIFSHLKAVSAPLRVSEKG